MEGTQGVCLNSFLAENLSICFTKKGTVPPQWLDHANSSCRHVGTWQHQQGPAIGIHWGHGSSIDISGRSMKFVDFYGNPSSKIKWDLTNGPLSKLLELLDPQV